MSYVRMGSMFVPASFAQAAAETAAAQPERREIATTGDGRDITRGYIPPSMLLQPQDTVLVARGGGNYAIYREVLRDDQVASTFAQRRLAVVSKEWEVEPGGKSAKDKAAAEFVREQLHDRWDTITDKMLYGVYYGYAVAECMWGVDGRFVTLDDVKVRDRRRFGFDGEMQLRLRTMSNQMPGELMPDRKFWTFCTGADHDDEPYGLGLAHWLYWPALFKKNGVKFWLTFLEKYGAPTATGKYPGNATAEEKTRLLQAVMAITTDSGVILPEGMAVELLQAARSGTADYTEIYDRMDRAIAKVVLGQTLTSEAVGGQYKAEVQMDVRQDLVKADSDLVCSSFSRTVARWLTEWNFPGAKAPRVWRQIDEGEDLEKRAKVDKVLHDLGYEPVDVDYISKTYGGTWRKKTARPNDRSPAADPAAEFAQVDRLPNADRDVVDQFADRLDAEARAAIDALIDPVRRLVMSAQSMDEIREGLLDLYPAMDTGAFAKLLQEAFTAAELAGRFEVAEGA